jgi:hypothetical protein
MMMLAQTTQAVSGMSSWNAAEWTVFFSAATAFLGSITTAIIAIIKSGNAQADAKGAQTRADSADEKAEHAITQAQNNNSKLIDIARDMPPKG